MISCLQYEIEENDKKVLNEKLSFAKPNFSFFVAHQEALKI
jgi:hypothetical protein